MKREEMVLTPEIAKTFLEKRHPLQRSLSMPYAEQLARDIREGRWNNVNHFFDPICISEKGELMNAQHRCMGVILSNTPIHVDVVYDVPDECFNFIDGTKARTVSQFMGDIKNKSTVVALVRFANSIENGNAIASAVNGVVDQQKKSHVYAGRIELLDYAEKDRDLLMATASQGVRIYNAFRGGSKAIFTDALWLIMYAENVPFDNIVKFVDEIVADTTAFPCIAKGKSNALKQLVEASRQRMRIDKLYWMKLILDMFNGTRLRRTTITTTTMEKTMAYFNGLVSLKQESAQKGG